MKGVMEELGWSRSIWAFILIWGVYATTAIFLAEHKKAKRLRGMFMVMTVFSSIVMIRYIPTRY